MSDNIWRDEFLKIAVQDAEMKYVSVDQEWKFIRIPEGDKIRIGFAYFYAAILATEPESPSVDIRTRKIKNPVLIL